nr:hypothetical protein CFP56_13043 [Quercus suber]
MNPSRKVQCTAVYRAEGRYMRGRAARGSWQIIAAIQYDTGTCQDRQDDQCEGGIPVVRKDGFIDYLRRIRTNPRACQRTSGHAVTHSEPGSRR